jgi:hypothetical protein
VGLISVMPIAEGVRFGNKLTIKFFIEKIKVSKHSKKLRILPRCKIHVPSINLRIFFSHDTQSVVLWEKKMIGLYENITSYENYENSKFSPCKNIIFKKSSKRNQNPSRY